MPSLEAASTQSLKRAVLDGGFTLVSRLAVEPAEADTLTALSVSGADLWRELRAVRLRNRAVTPVARRFWTFLSARAMGGG